MKTFFNFIANLTESQFVNITGATDTDLNEFKQRIKDNRFDAFSYENETTIKCLAHNFYINTLLIQLEPLAEKPLSSQLYWLIGDFVNLNDYATEGKYLLSLKENHKFQFATQTEEERYKMLKRHTDEIEQFNKKNKYNDHKEIIIDYNNPERWKQGLKALEDGAIVEMCEEAYFNFLECVPPKAFCGVSFVCGEPNNHNSKGQGIYLCGIKKGDKFYAQYGTIEQYKNKELFKIK